MSTEYNKTTWQNGDIITADKMNNIENGIKGIEEEATDLKSELTTLNDVIGINVYNDAFEFGGFDANGINTSDSGTARARTKGYTEVEPNATYTLCADVPSTYYFSISFYTKNDFTTARLSATSWSSVLPYTFTTPANTRYIRIIVKNGSSGVDSVSLSALTQVNIEIPHNYDTVNDAIGNLQQLELNPNLFVGWKQGYYASSNGAYEPNHNNYVCTVEPFAFNNGDIVIFPDLTDANPDAFYLNFYDNSKSYISSLAISKTTKNYRINLPNNASGYLHFSFSKSPSISPSTAPKITVYLNNALASKNYIMDALEFNGLYTPAWLNSIYYWDQGSVSYVANRIGIPFAMIARTPIRVSVNSGYKYAVFTFSSTTLSVATQLTNTGWITKSHEIKRGDIFAINMARTDDANITPEEGYANLTLQGFPEKDTGHGFVIESDLTKNYINTERIGTLSYGQSFCIYNGKYYSINGTKIAEQSSDFTVLRDVSLDTGHGNALQLGSGNIAYASGWDDQKIYAVNLDSLTVDHVITLPTTGYTTCAVDDLNGIIYIFQRGTLPDTETNYKFIVYDYVNEEIISQKVINKFGAMQAADYHNGKIVICWGLGTTTVPSGMAVYDTAGNILAEYSLSIFASAEPEGVCIDRDSRDLLISIGTALYKIYR